MKRFNESKISVVLFVFVVVIVLGGIAKADFTFGEVTRLPVPADIGNGVVECLSYDGLEMYIVAYNRPGGYGDWDLWVSKRATTDSDWGPMENLGPGINFSGVDDGPCISADGLTLYFTSRYRPGGNGHYDIFKTTRATKDDTWGQAVILPPPVNWTSTGGNAVSPWISPDGLEMYFDSMRPLGYGEWDIWVAKRTTEDDPWGDPVNLGPGVSSPYYEVFPSLSPDGLLLLFCDSPWGDPVRPGGYGDTDLWMARRASLSEPWQAAVNLGPLVNSSGYEGVPRITPDGRTLYFDRQYDTGQVPIIPIVDLNGDGIVDAADMCIMTDRWGEDYPLYDIGPFAWGDGIVDFEDLAVLAEHLFEQVDDPTLIAHWGLDETEGMVVTDSAGDNDGYALGEPIWQPDSGQVKGALQLDGVDDYVVTGMAPSPEKESYSVLAWIKGGAPGQVVLSQMGKANWLCTDPSTGALMTGLKGSGPNGRPLVSETIITDNNWHRIGFVWDGSYRRLYVDSVIVAEDEQDNLEISINGLYFGVGKDMEPGSFWSGLIDDVRIYKRVVTP